jgi:hypothetical protein
MQTIKLDDNPSDITGGTPSTPKDDVVDPSPTPETGEEQVPETEVEETPPEETPEESPETPPEEESPETPPEEPEPPAVDKEGDEKLPFNAHPRFKELVDEKNALKQQVSQYEPQARRIQVIDQYMQQHGIRPDQLQQSLEYLRFLNSDPAKAREVLKPIWEKLSVYTGDFLPPDLAEQVAAGTLSDVNAKELARGRGQQLYQEFRGQHQSAITQQQLITAGDQAMQAWAQTKMKGDLDLKPGTDRWNYMDAMIKNVRMMNPNLQPQEIVAEAEKIYGQTNQIFRKQRAAPALSSKKPLKSTQSTTKASPVVKTPEDVTRAILAGMRPHQLKYST